MYLELPPSINNPPYLYTLAKCQLFLIDVGSEKSVFLTVSNPHFLCCRLFTLLAVYTVFTWTMSLSSCMRMTKIIIHIYRLHGCKTDMLKREREWERDNTEDFYRWTNQNDTKILRQGIIRAKITWLENIWK